LIRQNARVLEVVLQDPVALMDVIGEKRRDLRNHFFTHAIDALPVLRCRIERPDRRDAGMSLKKRDHVSEPAMRELDVIIQENNIRIRGDPDPMIDGSDPAAAVTRAGQGDVFRIDLPQIHRFIRGAVVEDVDMKWRIRVAINALQQRPGLLVVIPHRNENVGRAWARILSHGLFLSERTGNDCGQCTYRPRDQNLNLLATAMRSEGAFEGLKFLGRILRLGLSMKATGR
jgi:hypothetical protein